MKSLFRKFWLFSSIFFFFYCNGLVATHTSKKAQKHYIDVMIPAAKKDIRTLDAAIQGIKRYGADIRRVIVVSDEPYTDQAEWFDEKKYPFSQTDLINTINQFVLNGKNYKDNIGWIYQQLLKFYALSVIPNIADNLLILDADTIFLNPVSFIDKKGNALYDAKAGYHENFFKHAARLTPNRPIKRVFKNYSGICNHMLFQKTVMNDLFNEIQLAHKKPVWQALITTIDADSLYCSCISEFEIYFNFIFGRHYRAKIRKLTWEDIPWKPDVIEQNKTRGLHYISSGLTMKVKKV